MAPSDTVSALKERISEHEGIPFYSHRLVVKGKTLEDEALLSEVKGQSIHMVLQLRGRDEQDEKKLVRRDFSTPPPAGDGVLLLACCRL
jgi:hypothetical protein